MRFGHIKQLEFCALGNSTFLTNCFLSYTSDTYLLSVINKDLKASSGFCTTNKNFLNGFWRLLPAWKWLSLLVTIFTSDFWDNFIIICQFWIYFSCQCTTKRTQKPNCNYIFLEATRVMSQPELLVFFQNFRAQSCWTIV